MELFTVQGDAVLAVDAILLQDHLNQTTGTCIGHSIEEEVVGEVVTRLSQWLLARHLPPHFDQDRPKTAIHSSAAAAEDSAL